MQSRSTAHQYLQLWAGSQEFREERSNWGYLLKVIQQHQEVLLSKEAFELIHRRLPGGFFQTQGMGDSRSNQCGIVKRFQGDKADTSGEVLPQVSRHLERQPRFADPTGASDDQEAYLCAPEQVTDGCHLLLAANQWCEGCRKGISVDRFSLDLRCDGRSQ